MKGNYEEKKRIPSVSNSTKRKKSVFIQHHHQMVRSFVPSTNKQTKNKNAHAHGKKSRAKARKNTYMKNISGQALVCYLHEKEKTFILNKNNL